MSTLNRYSLGSENMIPQGMVAIEYKICELCGRQFTRPITPTVLDHTESYEVFALGLACITRTREVRRAAGKKLCDKCLYAPYLEERAKDLERDQAQYREQFSGTQSRKGPKSSTRNLPNYPRVNPHLHTGQDRRAKIVEMLKICYVSTDNLASHFGVNPQCIKNDFRIIYDNEGVDSRVELQVKLSAERPKMPLPKARLSRMQYRCASLALRGMKHKDTAILAEMPEACFKNTLTVVYQKLDVSGACELIDKYQAEPTGEKQ